MNFDKRGMTPRNIRGRRNSDTKVLRPDAIVYPIRVITYAWGKHYVDILCEITLPAILAPGNLHYISSFTSCEIIILTEEKFFPQFAAASAVKKIREICPVRLIALDDLVSKKDKYGMALTHALHRGCSAYGAPMTETWFLFLNADFILADNCWRRLVPHLAYGNRVVCAPSYCVSAQEVAPVLLKQVDPASSSLSLSPRAMAALAIEHRHDTVKAKTLNVYTFRTRYMDQFYWQADDTTLLGRQMPVAVVGLWPERDVQEPNTFWDYGLIREFCPNAHIEVLGDSDDFMMVELRDKDVAQEVKVHRSMQPFEIAQVMVTWVTDYQKQFAECPLILHSENIPANAADAGNELKSRVDEILSYCPDSLPPAIGHPQWEYHFSSFMAGRHEFLSQQLGALTEDAPSESLSELDRIWWELDGLRKKYRRELSVLECAARDTTEDVGKTLGRFDESEQLKEASKIDWLSINADDSRQTILRSIKRPKFEESRDIVSELAHQRTLANQVNEFVLAAKERIEAEEKLRELVKSLDTHFQSLQTELRCKYEFRLRELEYEYACRLHLDEPTALPDIRFFRDPGPRNARRNSGRQVAHDQRIIEKYALRELSRVVAAAGLRGAANFLTVAAPYDTVHEFADHLPGAHVRVSLQGLLSPHFHKYFDTATRFDVCLCDLTGEDLTYLPTIADSVRPFMDATGIIAVLHRAPRGKVCAEDLGLLPAQSVQVVQTRLPMRFHLLRGFLIGARLLGLNHLARWILRYPAGAYERRVTQLWRMAGDDALWRSLTIVVNGPFEKPSEQLKAKQHLVSDGHDSKALRLLDNHAADLA